MVAPVYTSGMRIVAQPRTVEGFETMMKGLAKEAKTYKSPFVPKSKVENPVIKAKKEIVVYDPSKNPFAPLYKPDSQVLYKLDAYHQFEPPKYAGEKQKPKQLRYAVASNTVPPEDKPSNFNKIREKIPAYERANFKENVMPYYVDTMKNINSYKK